MGINKESDVSASLQIGPTDQGMVRIYVETDTQELPFDFEPDEADEIAEELMSAARTARAQLAVADELDQGRGRGRTLAAQELGHKDSLRRIEAAGSWDPVASLILCGPTRVRDLFVEGRAVVRGGMVTTIDLPRVITRQNQLARRLI